MLGKRPHLLPLMVMPSQRRMTVSCNDALRFTSIVYNCLTVSVMTMMTRRERERESPLTGGDGGGPGLTNFNYPPAQRVTQRKWEHYQDLAAYRPLSSPSYSLQDTNQSTLSQTIRPFRPPGRRDLLVVSNLTIIIFQENYSLRTLSN